MMDYIKLPEHQFPMKHVLIFYNTFIHFNDEKCYQKTFLRIHSEKYTCIKFH